MVRKVRYFYVEVGSYLDAIIFHLLHSQSTHPHITILTQWPTEQLPHHSPPRVCMAQKAIMEMANPSFFFGMSLSTPLTAHFENCNAPPVKTIKVDFFPRFELTNYRPRTYFDPLPNNGTYVNSIFESASPLGIQKPPSISRALLQN